MHLHHNDLMVIARELAQSHGLSIVLDHLDAVLREYDRMQSDLNMQANLLCDRDAHIRQLEADLAHANLARADLGGQLPRQLCAVLVSPASIRKPWNAGLRSRKIPAIQLYRETFGFSLKEAKDAVETCMDAGDVWVQLGPELPLSNGLEYLAKLAQLGVDAMLSLRTKAEPESKPEPEPREG